jgi:hypothetical protein
MGLKWSFVVIRLYLTFIFGNKLNKDEVINISTSVLGIFQSALFQR